MSGTRSYAAKDHRLILAFTLPLAKK